MPKRYWRQRRRGAPRGSLGSGVLGRDLAATGEVDDEVCAPGAGGPHRLIGGAVRGDDQLEPPAGVIEGERIGELGGDHRSLIVGGDDQRHAGRFSDRARLQRRAASQPEHRPQDQRIAEVRVGDQPGADPENEGQRDQSAPASSSAYKESVSRAARSQE